MLSHRLFVRSSRYVKAGVFRPKSIYNFTPIYNNYHWNNGVTSTNTYNFTSSYITIPFRSYSSKKKSNDDKSVEKKKTDTMDLERTASDWEVIRYLGRHLWPENSGLKMRVVIAFSLLVSAKLANVTVPYIFKCIVDGMTDVDALVAAGVGIPISLLVGCKYLCNDSPSAC